MRNIARLTCLVGVLLLTACGGAHEDDHAHDESDAHAHDGGDTHSHDAGTSHEHTEGSDAGAAPATQTFYADDPEGAPDPAPHGDSEPHAYDH